MSRAEPELMKYLIENQKSLLIQVLYDRRCWKSIFKILCEHAEKEWIMPDGNAVWNFASFDFRFTYVDGQFYELVALCGWGDKKTAEGVGKTFKYIGTKENAFGDGEDLDYYIEDSYPN